MTYIKLIISFITGKWKWLVFAGGLFVTGVVYGYWYSEKLYKAREAKIYQDWADSLIIMDRDYREREKALLASQTETQVKVKTIVKKIPHYITPDGCRVDDDGLQLIQNQVRDIFY